MKYFSYLLPLLFLITSCQDELGVKCHSYILGFYEFESIAANASVVFVDGHKYAKVNVYIPQARMVTDIFGNRVSENGSYHSLCDKYYDNSYPVRYLSPNANLGAPDMCCYPDTDIKSIIVKCDGTDISSIAYFVAVSVYPYIRNNYKESRSAAEGLSPLFKSVYNTDCLRNLYPIDKSLNELRSEDMLLLGTGHMCEPGGTGFEIPDILYPSMPIYGKPFEYNSENDLFTLFLSLDNELIKAESNFSISVTDTDGNEYCVEISMKE